MKKILFLIHDLGQGGAEKVLTNLVNNMDTTKFDITVVSLFGGGVNEQFLKSHVNYRAVFPRMIPGNRVWLKLFTPKQLHKMCVKEHYDIEVSYLEGPSARAISGCQDKDTKLVSWIHVEQHNMDLLSRSFRSDKEALWCYDQFDNTVCVSQFVKEDFCSILDFGKPCEVLYNTVESEKILEKSQEKVDGIINDDCVSLVAVGTLKQSKGYDRLLRIIKKLKENNYKTRLYILGIGPIEEQLKNMVKDSGIGDNVVFLGYDTNPYKYVSNCDLFVCASFAEGFSTAATEALIVGTPVCTVEVSGMKEMLGENNEYGIVTENSEEALYDGIKSLLDNPQLLAHYKEKAIERGKAFSTDNTVKAVENMLLSL